LGLTELGQSAVDLGEQEEPAEGAVLIQAGIAHGVLGRGYPGGPLGLPERPPAGGHMAADTRYYRQSIEHVVARGGVLRDDWEKQ